MLETGIDIIEIDRIAKSIANPSFLEKYFHPTEIDYADGSVNAAQHYAARFATKEAARKILLSYTDELSWTDTWIENDETGKPHMRFSDSLMEKVTIDHVSVSLSHSREQAVAIVLMEISRRN